MPIRHHASGFLFALATFLAGIGLIGAQEAHAGEPFSFV
jgi:hypothetical protein